MRARRSIVKEYDVVVIGGGLAGISAAISAARLGCKTALVQDRPVLGGNSSSEIRCCIGGAGSTSWPTRCGRETGIMEELMMENSFRNPHFSPSIWDTILWEWVTKEPNISLYLNTRARGAVMKNPTLIESVIADQVSTEKEYELKGRIFIDASGDGQVAHSAGAAFRMGREARSEHNESLAPTNGDSFTLGSTLFFSAKDVGRPVSFQPPPWSRDFPTDEALPFRDHTPPADFPVHSCWWIEYGGMHDTISDNEEIRDELLKLVFGVWDHIKNHGEHGADNLVLDWVSTHVAKRESRRFMGDHVLTQGDLQSQTLFPDRVAYGGWPIDLHPPEGIYAKSPPAEFTGLPGLYSIPLRSLYSKNIRNLMMAGRNISVTHVSLGSTRVQGTCAVIGQAAGTAAYLCTKYNSAPREIYENHVRELQQLLLKNDCYIIAVKNEDPEDIALRASVEVTSSMKLDVRETNGSEELDIGRAQMFLVTEPTIEKVALLLECTKAEDTEVRLGLRSASSIGDFHSSEDISSTRAVLPSGQRSWVEFPFKQKAMPDSYYWVLMPACPGVRWCHSNQEPLGTRRGFQELGQLSWKAETRRGSYCFELSPPSKPYGGKNVINGVSRPEDRPNIWISDPDESFPQYLDLDFGTRKMVNAVHLTFDTNLDRSHYEILCAGGRAMPECVKDYALHYYDGQSWVRILDVAGNYHRRRVHAFGATSALKLRLEVKATNGAPSARVFEMRAYYSPPSG